MLKNRKYFVTLGFFVNIGFVMSANFFLMSQIQPEYLMTLCFVHVVGVFISDPKAHNSGFLEKMAMPKCRKGYLSTFPHYFSTFPQFGHLCDFSTF